MKLNNGYKVEHDNENQVCIIPWPFIGCDEFLMIIKVYTKLGYKYWLPADERKGYILSKV